MPECLEGMWRDQLPDRVTGQLSAVDARLVDAHVAHCTACAGELQLLRLVHAARPQIAAPAIAAIVARLPRPADAGKAGSSRQGQPRVVSLADAPSRRQSAVHREWQGWRIAASALLVVGAGSAYLFSSAPQELTGSVGTVAAVESIAGQAPDLTPGVSLSYGGAWDLSEAEIQEVLATLEGWDGAPSTEIATTPVVLAGGGDQ